LPLCNTSELEAAYTSHKTGTMLQPVAFSKSMRYDLKLAPVATVSCLSQYDVQLGLEAELERRRGYTASGGTTSGFVRAFPTANTTGLLKFMGGGGHRYADIMLGRIVHTAASSDAWAFDPHPPPTLPFIIITG
jgi:hypothetical protein